MRLIRLLPALGLLLGSAQWARAERPADVLLRLVPPEAGATLAIEDLRTQAPRFWASPLSAGLMELAPVRRLLDSPPLVHFDKTCGEIERALGRPRTAIRDQLLGEAVVLALHLSPGEDPARASGLLLLRFADRALVDRFIKQINAAQTRDGTLVEVQQRVHRNQSYSVRIFKEGTKPEEYFAILPGRILAWSSSETAIQRVFDRVLGQPGLAQEPLFRKVRDQMPQAAVASLFVNPRFLDRALAANAKTGKPDDERLGVLLGRNLGAVQYAGLAVEWRDGFVVHLEEAIDPSKLDAPLLRWAKQPGSTASLVGRVPSSALALAAGHIDLSAVYDEVLSLVSPAERDRFDNTLLVLKGLLQGKDLATEVLPYVGPGAVAYFDAPEEDSGSPARVPLVLAVSLAGSAEREGVTAALDNALRTFLAMHALDPNQRENQRHVETRVEAGVRVTTLLGAGRHLSYAIDRSLLVIGTSPRAVASFVAAAGQSGSNTRFERMRAAFFPKAESFAFADLPAVYRFADARRDLLARRAASQGKPTEEEARGRLDEALALIKLFEGAFVTTRIESDFSAVHRTIGLVGARR
ncbi:MAG TPA: DUF3352 domain-containing protein [Isosphaeraceae bacterium]|nr:DUF3352 domain-containing protein [Isosphaeraceae bacterium]